MGSRDDLSDILNDLPLDGGHKVYYRPPQNKSIEYPCIVYDRDDSWVNRADNEVYHLQKRYEVTVIDRDPDSKLADMVELLRYCRFVRSFVSDGLNHFVFQLFF